MILAVSKNIWARNLKKDIEPPSELSEIGNFFCPRQSVPITTPINKLSQMSKQVLV